MITWAGVVNNALSNFTTSLLGFLLAVVILLTISEIIGTLITSIANSYQYRQLRKAVEKSDSRELNRILKEIDIENLNL